MVAKGLLFILSSPSGAGKTSVCKKLLAQDQRLFLSVSATTRPPRPQEQEGRDYVFLSSEVFNSKRQDGHFLESAQVFDHWYGTPREAVEAQLTQGRDVLFDVDWQGGRAIAQKWGGHGVVRIFILPPSLALLEERLRKRAQDTEAVVQRRMARALDEMSHWAEYDYVVVNQDLDETVRGVHHIIQAERLKRSHQPHLFEWMEALKELPPQDALFSQGESDGGLRKPSTSAEVL